MATNNQLISSGWADSNSTPVGRDRHAGPGPRATVAPATALSTLNGQAGVARGQILVTDRAGHSATIDLTNAQTITDVINAINNTAGIDVTASAQGGSIVLTDTSGGSALRWRK